MSIDNPQLEDGFTPIANAIMDALARTRFSGYERSILDFLFRKTYGWSKKSDLISLSQFVDGTGILKPHIIRTIKRLVERNVITKNGNGNLTRYEFNKHWGEWKSLPKMVTLPKMVIQSLPKMVPTISRVPTISKKIRSPNIVENELFITKNGNGIITKPLPKHKFKIPHLTFDPHTLELSTLDDEGKRAFAAACPKANLDDCLKQLKAWIIKKGTSYENYWRTLCTFGSKEFKGGTNGTRGYRPNITDAIFTGEDFVRNPNND